MLEEGDCGLPRVLGTTFSEIKAERTLEYGHIGTAVTDR